MKTYSFEIQSENQLMQSFRFQQQRHVLLPKDLTFPVRAEYYKSWTEPSGVYRYLIFHKPDWDGPRGLVFRKTGGPYSPATRMCDWCQFFGSSDQVDMLSVKVNPRCSFAVMVCLDLRCQEKVETLAELSGRDPEKLMTRVCERIGRFFESAIEREPPDLHLA